MKIIEVQKYEHEGVFFNMLWRRTIMLSWPKRIWSFCGISPNNVQLIVLYVWVMASPTAGVEICLDIFKSELLDPSESHLALQTKVGFSQPLQKRNRRSSSSDSFDFDSFDFDSSSSSSESSDSYSSSDDDELIDLLDELLSAFWSIFKSYFSQSFWDLCALFVVEVWLDIKCVFRFFPEKQHRQDFFGKQYFVSPTFA